MSAFGESLREGLRSRAANPGHWVHHVLLLAFLAGLATAGWSLVEVGASGLEPRLVVAPVPAGAWAVTWSPGLTVPADQQAAALGRLTRTAWALVLLLGLLSLATLSALWMQRRHERRGVWLVHRAVGARRKDLLALGLGEAAVWTGIAVAAGALAGGAVLGLVAMSWPGMPLETGAMPPLSLGAATVLAVSAFVLPLGWPASAGRRRVDFSTPPGLLEGLATSTPVLVAISFAVLVGAGLVLQAGRRGSAPEQPIQRSTEAPRWRVTAPPGQPPGARARVLAGMAGVSGPAGGAAVTSPRWFFAQAGAASGLGLVDVAMTECGACFEGGMPLPVRAVRAEIHALTPDTFDLLGFQIVEGRDLAPTDRWATRPVAVVNEHLARRHFQGGEAVGRRVRLGRSGWLDVVGVVRDGDPESLGSGDGSPYRIYAAALQAVPDPVDLWAPRATVGESPIPHLPPGWTVESLAPERDRAPVRWFARLLLAGGLLGLASAALGVRAVTARRLARRRFELGVRRAVGARRGRLVAWLVSGVLVEALAGLVLGAWLALFFLAPLRDALGPVSLLSSALWVLPTAALTIGAMAGALGPARSALKRAPDELLRASPPV